MTNKAFDLRFDGWGVPELEFIKWELMQGNWEEKCTALAVQNRIDRININRQMIFWMENEFMELNGL